MPASSRAPRRRRAAPAAAGRPGGERFLQETCGGSPSLQETLTRGAGGAPYGLVVVTVEEVRRLALTLPRTTEHLIHDRVKFRVGQIVYVAFSRDETEMGFAFPREEREALVAARPDVFALPRESDLRYHWVVARLAALDHGEMEELVTEAWRMVVPRFLARERLGTP
jgi:hypothetical protein